MSQVPSPQDNTGKITLTWSNKPGAPRPQTTTIGQLTRPQAPPTPQPEPPPQPKVEPPAACQPAPASAPQPEITPAPQPEPAVEPTSAPAGNPARAAESSTGKKKGGVLFDTVLVMSLAGLIGLGAWYVHQQMQMYRVPTPLELAQSEHLELCKQHEQLQNAAYKADEQIHMSGRLAYLDKQLADIKGRIVEEKQGIAQEQNRIQELQREIRQEDKTSRAIARGMLIGLHVGDVSTTSGRVYNSATIHRLEGGRITLRTPIGQVCFPTSQLVKDNLPDMVRYAFGLDEMVDMTDFEAANGQPEPSKRRQGRLITPRKHSAEASYEPQSGAPTLDTGAHRQADAPVILPEDDGSWQPPAEALPIGE